MAERTLALRVRRHQAGKGMLGVGALLAGVGLAFLIATLVVGELSLISIGLLSFGVLAMLRGALLIKRNRPAKDEGVYPGVRLPAARVLPRKAQ